MFQLLTRTFPRVSLVPRDITSEDSNLSPSDVRSGLKLSLIDGMFAQVHITITAGAFLTGFALLLGAGNITLGVIAALPFMIQPLQLLAAWLIERVGRRKPLAVIGSLGRPIWLAIMLLPYLPLPPTLRLPLLVLSLFISNAMLALAVNAWTNWMTDLVPPRLRGRYFSTRNTLLAAIAMGVNAGAGLWLDRMGDVGRAADGYAVLFGVAIICGGLSTLLLSRQPEPAMVRRARLPLVDVLRIPLRSPSFRRFLGAMIVWHLALGVAAPFFSAHALQVLDLPFTTLASFDVITGAVSLLTLPLWGRIADRVGHRWVLFACMAGVVPVSWTWVFATPDSMWLLYTNAVVSGIWWPGLMLALSNRLMEQAPAEARGAYLAVFASMTGLAFFVASTLAGGLANLLADTSWMLGSYEINNYQTLFIAGSLLRLGVVLFGRKAL